MKNYEEGNLEDSDSDGDIHLDSGTDRTRHYELHGPRPNSILRKEITLSTTKELTASKVLSVFFFMPEMCHNLNILRNFAHANENKSVALA